MNPSSSVGNSNTSSGQTSKTSTSTSNSVSSTVHINKQRESTQNLNYKKKCCWKQKKSVTNYIFSY